MDFIADAAGFQRKDKTDERKHVCSIKANSQYAYVLPYEKVFKQDASVL